MKIKKQRKKWVILTQSIIAVVVIGGVFGFIAYNNYKINQIPGMTFEEMLLYTTGNNDEAAVTVGIIKDGEESYTLYGTDGEVLPQKEHIYEIGSITKTFTASLLLKAISEGKINLDDTVEKYMELPEKDYYPTLKRLITHTSGYKNYYFEMPMTGSFLTGKNSFYGISPEKLTDRTGNIDLEDRDYEFNYSNFGISVTGAVLSEVYTKEFTALINEFIRDELGLTKTMISNGSGDLRNYWDWKENDAYMPAGALTSTIGDMMKYAQLQLDGYPEYLLKTHETLAVINNNSENNKKMNIHMDSIGAAWIKDETHNIIWHNGGTGDFNSYIGFDPDKRLAVVILSNLPPGYRIPATVMGVKLLTDLQKQ